MRTSTYDHLNYIRDQANRTEVIQEILSAQDVMLIRQQEKALGNKVNITRLHCGLVRIEIISPPPLHVINP